MLKDIRKRDRKILLVLMGGILIAGSRIGHAVYEHIRLQKELNARHAEEFARLETAAKTLLSQRSVPSQIGRGDRQWLTWARGRTGLVYKPPHAAASKERIFLHLEVEDPARLATGCIVGSGYGGEISFFYPEPCSIKRSRKELAPHP